MAIGTPGFAGRNKIDPDVVSHMVRELICGEVQNDQHADCDVRRLVGPGLA